MSYLAKKINKKIEDLEVRGDKMLSIISELRDIEFIESLSTREFDILEQITTLETSLKTILEDLVTIKEHL